MGEKRKGGRTKGRKRDESVGKRGVKKRKTTSDHATNNGVMKSPRFTRAIPARESRKRIFVQSGKMPGQKFNIQPALCSH